MHVVNIITKLSVGGAQETVLRTCARLDPDRFDCTIVAGCDPSPEGELRDRARLLGCRIVDIPVLHRSIRPVADIRSVVTLTRVLRDLQPDVVHTHSSKAGVVGRLAARLARVPVVVHTVHGWSFSRVSSRIARRAVVTVERVLARFTDALVVVTVEDERAGLAHRIGRAKEYRLIRSGIDVEALRSPIGLASSVDAPDRRPASARNPTRTATRTVGTVMRLSAQKDPLAFVEAAATVARAREHDDVRFVIVGDGPLRPDVEHAIGGTGIEDRFELTGAVTDVIPLVRRFDVFVLPSRWEGLPRVIVEAMAVGVPVIATAVGGVGEIVVDGETGLLVPAGDPAGMASAIARVLDEPALADRLSRAASERVEQFDERRMADALGQLYDELLSATRRAGA